MNALFSEKFAYESIAFILNDSSVPACERHPKIVCKMKNREESMSYREGFTKLVLAIPALVVSVLSIAGLLEAATNLRIKTVQIDPNSGQNIGDILGAEVCLIGTDGSIRRQVTGGSSADTIFVNVLQGNQTIRAWATGFNQRTVTTSVKPEITNFQQMGLIAGSNPPEPCNVRGPQDIQVSFSQTTPPNPVSVGSITEYGFGLKNPSSVPLSNVIGKVTFPPGFRSPSVTPGSGFTCTATGGTTDTVPITVNCTASSFPAGSARSADITVKSPSSISGNSQDFIIRGEADPQNAFIEDPSNNVKNVTTNLIKLFADLDPDVSGSDIKVFLYEEYTYQVKVINAGNGSASNVRTRITLPPEAEFLRTEGSTFSSCPREGQVLNCQAAISPGTEKSIQIIARPRQSTPGGRQMLLTVGVDPDNLIAESSETNNVAGVTTITEIAPCDLQIVNLDESDMIPGISFRVRNNGPNRSLPSSVRLTVPSGCSFNSNTGGTVLGLPAGENGCPTNPCPIAAIDPGQQSNKTHIGADCPQGSGTVQWGLCVDPNNLLPETNEPNNCIGILINYH